MRHDKLFGYRFACLIIVMAMSPNVIAGDAPESLSHTTAPENSICEPSCRGSFICRNGACVSPCQPLCGQNEYCESATGKCVPKIEMLPSSEPTPQTVSDPAPSQARDAEAQTVLDLLHQEEKRSQEKKKAQRKRRFAALINPGALIFLPILYSIWTVPISFQMGFTYLGFDITATGFFGEMMGASGELGLRILPFGEGLRGLYIVGRVGGGYPLGFMVSGEIGYAFMPKHFALNLGAGGGWTSEVGALPFGNVSLGFGF